MTYIQFRDQFHSYKIFSINDIRKSFYDFDSRRLVEWQHKGYIQKVINRWYVFTDNEIDDNMKLWVANRIYHPSYISLESALSYHNLIPEAVYTTTSLTSNKTISFNTSVGNYAYRHIKSSAFFGYQLIKWKGFPLRMAELEKVLLDYLYLYAHISSEQDLHSLRLNTDDLKKKLSLEKFRNYLSLFDNKALAQRATALLDYLDVC
ncbi:MAG: hypothetical protein AAF789_03840 [Bacteroidota bacterium]